MVTDIFVTCGGAATARRASSYLQCASGAVVYGATALRRRAAIYVTSRGASQRCGQWAQLVLRVSIHAQLMPHFCSDGSKIICSRVYDRRAGR